MLTLPIKKKWFDMILSGEKKEEYREIKPYWTKRFEKYIVCSSPILKCSLTPFSDCVGYVIFKNGYRKDSPKIKCCCQLGIGIGKEEWGAEPGEICYILKILSVEEKK